MAEEDKGEENRRSGMAYAAALSLFFSVMSFCAIGYFLDRWLGTRPWLLVAGIVLGAAIGFFEFVRLISRIS
jgi:ATP synthase protein I